MQDWNYHPQLLRQAIRFHVDHKSLAWVGRIEILRSGLEILFS